MEGFKSIFTYYNNEKNQNNEKIENNENKINKEKKVKKCDYDVIIDIQSIGKLKEKGWNIIYSGDKKKQKEIIESKYKIIISVLGNSNRGKTYLLNKLSNVNLETGYQTQTKGLSMKFHGELIYLDTAGTNTPLLLEDGKKRPSEAEIHNIHLCQIITNYIIQTFVIENADILVCVIGMLNSAEQIFLEKIKKLCENKRNLIVIHNLVKCFNSADIEKYKTETLLKMIGTELIEKNIPYFKEGYKGFDKYFLEKGNKHIKHFIFANDEKKSQEIDYYNETTLNYIRTCIKMERKKPKDLFKQLINHIKNISSFVLQNEISPKIEDDLIKCNQEVAPKDIKADELDNINFIGKEYEPHHRYYRKGKFFIIEIQLCSNKYELKCNKTFDIDLEETQFEIIGKRELDDKNDGYFTFTNKRINFKSFKIKFKIKLSDFGINHIDQEPIQKMKYGILFIIYKSL
jgi:hypothetical protein